MMSDTQQISAARDTEDLWLERSQDERVTRWVRQENANTLSRLIRDANLEAMQARIAAALSGSGCCPLPASFADHLYDLHQDEFHPRGVYRRTTLASYRSARPQWHSLLDVDALAVHEGRSWFLNASGAVFSPSGRRVLLPFADGGGLATLREVDTQAGGLVAGGFCTPQAHQSAVWLDEDTLLVAVALTEADATASGGVQRVRLWRRGELLAEAQIVFDGGRDGRCAFVAVAAAGNTRYVLVQRELSANVIETLLVTNGGALEPLALPTAVPRFVPIVAAGVWIAFKLLRDWITQARTFGAGSVVAMHMTSRLAHLVYQPRQNESVFNLVGTADAIYLNVLRDVSGCLVRCRPPQDEADEWSCSECNVPSLGSVTLPAVSNPHAGDLLFQFESFLTPPITFMANADGRIEQLRTQPARSDLSAFKTERRFAIAKDGTRVAYFVVGPKQRPPARQHRVLMTTYGGFGHCYLPGYSMPFLGPVVDLWLQEGGSFVLAHPRGGGEYGPAWHEASRLATRQVGYEDLYAIAEDLIAAGDTSARNIGFIGASHAGLTTAVVCTQRPDLFGAGVALVPICDMLRYPRQPTGPMWVSEYGDPQDPQMAAYLRTYSPYHSLDPGREYPPLLLMTSTTDGNVHPCHARRMAAKMARQGHSYLFFEAAEGGHVLAGSARDRALHHALQLAFLLRMLPDSG